MIDHIRTIRICSVYVGPDYPTAPGSSPPTVLNKVGILSGAKEMGVHGIALEKSGMSIMQRFNKLQSRILCSNLVHESGCIDQCHNGHMTTHSTTVQQCYVHILQVLK